MQCFPAVTHCAPIRSVVAQRVGSLEKGKDANVVIFNDHPLRCTSAVEQVHVDGVKRYDRATVKEPWELEE